jgi:prepilin-type N-terminal cleavage/methylation domain-containing protein
MNKKGFTFVELLAVIVLIGIIIGISIPTIRYADRKFHEKAYKTKIELIKNAAQEYGDDNKEVIIYATGGSTYTDPASGASYPSITITVEDLLNNGYITKDNDIKDEDILDPRNKSSMLNKTIIIYIKNNRAYAKID